MPIGTFLDSFPSVLFIGAHVAFIVIGLWAIMRARAAGSSIAGPLWLYVAVHPFFIAYLTGVITVRLAVLTEQTLIVAMVIWMAVTVGRPATTRG